jgi:AcrR family transcriptional regulator
MTQRADLSRRQLKAVAIDCFARHGYQGTTIDRIARDAGVTKGAIYCHFRDKEDLLFEAVRDRVSGFEHKVLDTTANGDPVATFRGAADACFFFATVSNHRRFIITLMVEALDTNPRLSNEFRNMLRRMRAFLAAAIRTGQERHVFREDAPAEVVAAAFVGGIMGAEIQHYQDPEQADLRRILDIHVEQTLAWITAPQGAEMRSGGIDAW